MSDPIPTEVHVTRTGPQARIELEGDVDLEYRWLLDEVLEDVDDPSVEAVVVDVSRCTFLDFSSATAVRRACQSHLADGDVSVVGAVGIVRRVMALASWPLEWFDAELAPVIPLDAWRRMRSAGSG